MSTMLTTVDNPYDPFTEYDRWWQYDTQCGYYSAALLARIAVVADDLPLPSLEQAIEDAIDEIVRVNASGVHRKVVRE